MGAALYISFDSPTSAEGITVDGKHMLTHMDNIPAIGEDHGLIHLDEYVSQTMEQVLEFIDSSIASKDQLEEYYQEQWFDPTEGLELMEKYIDFVKNYHSLSDTTKRQCLPDLECYRDVLKILVDENVRWHFSYDL